MEPEDRRLLTETHGLVRELKPLIEATRADVSGLDNRTRNLEVAYGAHDVKITRIQSDLDGMGRKFRAASQMIKASPTPVPDAGERGLLRTTFEFLAEAPTYAHVIVSGVSLLVAVAATLWKHR